MAKRELVTNKESLINFATSLVTESGTKVTKKLVTDVVNAFLEGIEVSVANGVPVHIHEYLDVDVRATEARMARNPQTGEPVEIPAGYKVHVRPMGRLKEAVSNL